MMKHGEKMLVVFLLAMFAQYSSASIFKDADASENSKIVDGDEEIGSVLPRFSWMNSSSIRVVLPNGFEDVIQLWQTEKVRDRLVSCLFEGKMKNDETSFVTIMGCQHDDDVSIEIYAKLFQGHKKYNIKNGTTEEIASGNLNRRKLRIKRDGNAKPPMPPLPPYLLYDVRLGYEESLLAKLGSHEAAKEYIMKVFTLANVITQQPSLGTIIRLRAQESILFVPNKYWEANSQSIYDAQDLKRNQNNTIPIMFFCGGNGTNAMAYIRKGCDPKRGVGIQEHQEDLQSAVIYYLHELGHWMGLRDDEDEDRHSATQCSGTGLMSTVEPAQRPQVWSMCSQRRFPKWFHRYGSCLKIDSVSVLLKGGSTPNEGNVYARNSENKLGPVCDDSWGDTHARVVCRQLGYDDGVATSKSHFGNVSSEFAMDDVNCNGKEAEIQNCTYKTSDDCAGSEGAGVICSKECEEGAGRIFPSCDECKHEFFGYPDCKPCSCSPEGSKNQTCDTITGKCHCKDFYYGRSCAYPYHQDAGKNLRLQGSNSFISSGSGSNSNPPGSWPWGVSIGWLDENGLWHHFCSGVIASTTKIITTANCLSTLEQDEQLPVSQMMIRAGDNMLKAGRDDYDTQSRNFLKFTIHPGYEWDYHYLDIAVITLNSSNPLIFNRYVRSVYIPSHMESKEKAEMEHLLLTVSGWGQGVDGKGGEALKDAVVAVFPNEYCISNYNGYRLMDKLFKDDVFCGGNPVNLQGVCAGDDGSPAVMLDHSKKSYILVGLLSMSNRHNEGFFDDDGYEIPFCGLTTTPNIFVRIASESIISFLYKEIHGDLDPYMPEIKAPLQCGRNAIVDGTFNSGSNVGKWPWMVSVGRPNPDNLNEWLHHCGGSIVSETKVITAAHCIKDYANFSVRAGDSDLKNAIDDAEVQSRLVLSSDIYEKYDANNDYRYFDIAVLTLATPLTFDTAAVRPICLNTLEDLSVKDDETYSHLVTSGWGNGDQMGDTAVMVFSELLCNSTHENRRDNQNLVPNLFTDDVMCAGDPAGETGTCQGDSGGPAVYFDATKKRYFLRAVISGSAHGICGSIQFPNIYVRVESIPIYEWIQEMINK